MLNKQGLFSRHESKPNRLSRSGEDSDNPGNGQQKPVLQPLMPGHFAALESATTVSPVTEHKPTKSEAATGSRLIVGPEVKLKGAEIQDCDTLVVEGRVEATMDSRVIQIAQHGSFSGKVGIDIAEIHGQFDGELTARTQLIIHSGGRVSGKIRYGKILIEEGGQLSGDIASLASENKAVAPGSVRGTRQESAAAA